MIGCNPPSIWLGENLFCVDTSFDENDLGSARPKNAEALDSGGTQIPGGLGNGNTGPLRAMFFQAERAVTYRQMNRRPRRAFPCRESIFEKPVPDGSLQVLFRVLLTLSVELSRRFTGKLDAVGAVHDTITDGIGYSGIAYHLVPAAYGHLRDNDGGFSPDSLLQDFEQAQTAGSIKGLQA